MTLIVNSSHENNVQNGAQNNEYSAKEEIKMNCNNIQCELRDKNYEAHVKFDWEPEMNVSKSSPETKALISLEENSARYDNKTEDHSITANDSLISHPYEGYEAEEYYKLRMVTEDVEKSWWNTSALKESPTNSSTCNTSKTDVSSNSINTKDDIKRWPVENNSVPINTCNSSPNVALSGGENHSNLESESPVRYFNSVENECTVCKQKQCMNETHKTTNSTEVFNTVKKESCSEDINWQKINNQKNMTGKRARIKRTRSENSTLGHDSDSNEVSNTVHNIDDYTYNCNGRLSNNEQLNDSKNTNDVHATPKQRVRTQSFESGIKQVKDEPSSPNTTYSYQLKNTTVKIEKPVVEKKEKSSNHYSKSCTTSTTTEKSYNTSTETDNSKYEKNRHSSSNHKSNRDKESSSSSSRYRCSHCYRRKTKRASIGVQCRREHDTSNRKLRTLEPSVKLLPSGNFSCPITSHLKYKKYMHVETHSNGGASVVHMYQKEIEHLSKDQIKELAYEFFKVTFSEDENNHAYHVMGIVHGAANYLPDLLEYMAMHHGTLTVKNGVLGRNSDIETSSFLQYHEQVSHFFCLMFIIMYNIV